MEAGACCGMELTLVDVRLGRDGNIGKVTHISHSTDLVSSFEGIKHTLLLPHLSLNIAWQRFEAISHRHVHLDDSI